MIRFHLTAIATLSWLTGIIVLQGTPAQADEVRLSCGDRLDTATTVSLNSGGVVPLVQWSTSDLGALARAVQQGCRVESERASSSRVYINTASDGVKVDHVEVKVPSASSITVNVDSPTTYPTALW